MFEVGKTYKHINGGNLLYTCEWGKGDWAVISWPEHGTCKAGMAAVKREDFSYHIEVKPEPKRWSTWQNIYESGATAHHPLRDIADGFCDKWARLNGHRLAVLRRDYEQPEGQLSKCIKVELEQ